MQLCVYLSLIASNMHKLTRIKNPFAKVFLKLKHETKVSTSPIVIDNDNHR